MKGSCLCGAVRYENCGSQLVSMHSSVVGETVAGTLDDDLGMQPSEHILVGSKASWYEITDALPQHAEWPPGMSADG
jgi:hypothetical protein